MKGKQQKPKRCYGCKHFLSKAWHHNYCRACRKVAKVLKPKVIEQIEEKIKGPIAKCPKCGKDKPKPEVRPMNKPRECLACYSRGQRE